MGTRELIRILGNHNEGLSIDFLRRVDSGQFGNLFGHCLKELVRDKDISKLFRGIKETKKP